MSRFTGDSATIVMMKHLQEPVPSVLEERPDVPPPIGRVVARAMAKVPGNRYQNVSELIEDLTIASGMIVPVPIAQPSNSATTSESPAVSTTSDDRDEVTVVRPRRRVSLGGATIGAAVSRGEFATCARDCAGRACGTADGVSIPGRY